MGKKKGVPEGQPVLPGFTVQEDNKKLLDIGLSTYSGGATLSATPEERAAIKAYTPVRPTIRPRSDKDTIVTTGGGPKD